MSKEYTYDIDKYTIGVDENGEGGIGLTVAKIENEGIIFQVIATVKMLDVLIY